MDSGVSVASRSSTFLSSEGSSEDWTSSALAWASVTFCSASSMKRLKTVYSVLARGSRHVSLGLPYLDSADVCVLGRVLVLVQTILGQLALA